MTQAFNLSQFANKLNSSGQTDNTGLQNSSVTVTAGTGMSGGGAIALGSSATLTNAGVTSIVAGTGISISGATGAVTVTSSVTGGGGRGQTFTANGTFTIPTGITAIKVTVVGGGGNGGGSGYILGSGGGGGGAAIKYFTGLTPGNTIAVTVGGSAGTSQVASGTQSITTISASGGATSGVNIGGLTVPGAGGIGSNGDLNIKGGPGSFAESLFGGSCCAQTWGGSGGNSILGGGAVTTLASAGSTGGAYGGGGSGGTIYYMSGGAGASGVVIFEW